jgi:hypothetical protein
LPGSDLVEAGADARDDRSQPHKVVDKNPGGLIKGARGGLRAKGNAIAIGISCF